MNGLLFEQKIGQIFYWGVLNFFSRRKNLFYVHSSATSLSPSLTPSNIKIIVMKKQNEVPLPLVVKSEAVGPADLKHFSTCSVLCCLLSLELLMHRIKHKCLFAEEVLPWFGLGGRQSSIKIAYLLFWFFLWPSSRSLFTWLGLSFLTTRLRWKRGFPPFLVRRD